MAKRMRSHKGIQVEKVLFGASMVLFVLVTIHKLTFASLWYDETVEYWYSKVLIGPLPFEDTANMYERIVTTYQPPLYNAVMWLWLHVSDGEWWFRLFGIFVGAIGMVGLYKAMARLSNGFVGSLAVVVATFTYRLTYYWQECAEYNLMLASLFWTIYFWVCLMEEPGKRSIVLFTISAIVPIYSQYGAVYPVFAMALVALVKVLSSRDHDNIVAITVSGLSAVLFAGLPLYFLFMKKQILYQNQQIDQKLMLFQQGSGTTQQPFQFDGGVIRDLYRSLKTVVAWNFLPNCSIQLLRICIVVVVVALLVAAALSQRQTFGLFVVVNAIAWLSFWLSVKACVYSYGSFGNRYGLIFIPLWIVLVLSMGTELCHVIGEKLPNGQGVASVCVGGLLCLAFCYSYLSWTTLIEPNWDKEEARAVVDEWYKAGGADSKTLVYYAADSGFAYYVRQNPAFDDAIERTVTYMPVMRSATDSEFAAYITEVYGDNWPDELYVVATHVPASVKPELDAILGTLESQGYSTTVLYDTRGYLIRLRKS